MGLHTTGKFAIAGKSKLSKLSVGGFAMRVSLRMDIGMLLSFRSGDDRNYCRTQLECDAFREVLETPCPRETERDC